MGWGRAPQGALLVHTAWPQLLQLIPLMPWLQLLRHNLPGHQSDGVVRILLQRRRTYQSGVWRRGFQDSSWGQCPFLPLSLLLAACHRRGGQEALSHVQILRGEKAGLCCGPDGAEAGLRVAGVLVWAREAGDAFLLCSIVESVGRWAELWDLSGSVLAGRVNVGGGRVLWAAVLRAGLVRTQRRVLRRTHQEVSCTAPLGQPAPSSTVVWAEALLVSRWFTFGKSAETYQVKL